MGREKRIRKSQVISTYGVGAIVEFPDESLMHAGIDAWCKSEELNLVDDRLSKRLGIPYFYEPVNAPENNISGGGTLPFVRFPLWHVCPRCKAMKKTKWNSNKTPVCSSTVNPGGNRESCSQLNDYRKVKMQPVRFIMACESGHIEDFPWIEWVHTTKENKLQRGNSCSDPVLKLQSTGKAGLMGLSVTCVSCSKKRTMVGAASFDRMKDFGCNGERPWLGPDSNECNCSETPRVVQRGATNVHFSHIISSILIPPYSTYIRRLISRKKTWETLTNGIDEDGNPEMIRVKMFSEQKDIPVEELLEAIKHKINGGKSEQGKQVDENDYRYDEYKAFCASKNSDKNNDLNIWPQDIDDYEINIRQFFKNIVLVEKLTETKVLTGFSRLTPSKNKVASLSLKRTNWLPAIRAYGEGIFFIIKQEFLDEWSLNPNVQFRTNILQKRLSMKLMNYEQPERVISPSFILLHTLSHLLIRQLSFDCGYGSSSIRERIYCRQDGEQKMSGILLYTSSSDSDGTLGGLVRQGKPDRFEETFKGALVNAVNCSSDPLCSESTGQGSDALNLSACHACALLAETSCEEGNRLLDRKLLVGDPEEKGIGFFEEYLNSVY